MSGKRRDLSIPWPFAPAEVALNRDTNLLKLVAMLTMLCDHAGKMLFPQYPVMRIIGRIAFPIYAYCLAAGCVYTRNPLNYLKRIVLLALISPLYSLDTGALARAMARSRETELALSQQAEQAAQRLSRSIIEEECAAYILDKAAETGITLDAASVTARWDEDGFWYPWEARLDGADGSKKQLAPVIEAQLGIPEARQYWSCDEDT